MANCVVALLIHCGAIIVVKQLVYLISDIFRDSQDLGSVQMVDVLCPVMRLVIWPQPPRKTTNNSHKVSATSYRGILSVKATWNQTVVIENFEKILEGRVAPVFSSQVYRKVSTLSRISVQAVIAYCFD